MAETLHRLARTLLWLAALATAALALLILARQRPQDVPFTPLDLGEPAGLFTGRKLAGLADDPAHCRALLDRAGVRYARLPDQGGAQCRVEAPLRPTNGGARTIALRPASVAPSCPVVAALAMWEWQVVQPAARTHLDDRIVAIRHFGSYSCRRMYGRGTGDWSEHARANALDVAAFVTADGREISVVRDWRGTGSHAAFLRAVRDGACDLFATVLSPDYNAAHRDHLHLDQAPRGATGWRACR